MEQKRVDKYYFSLLLNYHIFDINSFVVLIALNRLIDGNPWGCRRNTEAYAGLRTIKTCVADNCLWCGGELILVKLFLLFLKADIYKYSHFRILIVLLLLLMAYWLIMKISLFKPYHGCCCCGHLRLIQHSLYISKNIYYACVPKVSNATVREVVVVVVWYRKIQ